MAFHKMLMASVLVMLCCATSVTTYALLPFPLVSGFPPSSIAFYFLIVPRLLVFFCQLKQLVGSKFSSMFLKAGTFTLEARPWVRVSYQLLCLLEALSVLTGVREWGDESSALMEGRVWNLTFLRLATCLLFLLSGVWKGLFGMVIKPWIHWDTVPMKLWACIITLVSTCSNC